MAKSDLSKKFKSVFEEFNGKYVQIDTHDDRVHIGQLHLNGDKYILLNPAIKDTYAKDEYGNVYIKYRLVNKPRIMEAAEIKYLHEIDRKQAKLMADYMNYSADISDEE